MVDCCDEELNDCDLMLLFLLINLAFIFSLVI